MRDWQIEYSLLCRGPGSRRSRCCAYELRTLAVASECPECGWGISKTLIGAYETAQGDRLVWDKRMTVHPGVRKLAARSAYSVETIELLLEARRFVFAAGRESDDTPVALGHEMIEPAAQCLGLRDYFRLHFGLGDAAEGLRDRHLFRRDLVCGVVQQLAGFGVIRLGPRETVAAYHDVACPDPLPASLHGGDDAGLSG